MLATEMHSLAKAAELQLILDKLLQASQIGSYEYVYVSDRQLHAYTIKELKKLGYNIKHIKRSEHMGLFGTKMSYTCKYFYWDHAYIFKW